VKPRARLDGRAGARAPRAPSGAGRPWRPRPPAYQGCMRPPRAATPQASRQLAAKARPECARRQRPHAAARRHLRQAARGGAGAGQGRRRPRPAGERPLRRGDHRIGGQRRRDAALLLSLGASAKQVTSRYDGTALIAAAHLGHAGVVRQLIAAGAPLDHVNNLHWTAAIEAVVLGDGGPRHQATLAGAGRRGRQPASWPTAKAARRCSWRKARGYTEMVLVAW
jgi:hypothetical protein